MPLNGVIPGSRYQMQIRAINGCNSTGGWSVLVSYMSL
jgi:hypothetical protein